MSERYVLSDDTWGIEEKAAILKVIDSGRFTMGENVKSFENKFADFFGSKYAVMSNSGSSANLLAVAALVYSGRLSAGDEVIVPAVSWSTTYFPLSQYGLKLRFVDIDRKTLNIDVSKLESAITSKTKAIFLVNLLGNPNDFEKIIDICSNNNLIMLEDNCESMGGKYKNKYLGTFGVLGTFSTFYSHHICTMEGGVTLTDDFELYQYLLSIRAHGWTRSLPEHSTIYNKMKDPFYESFNFIMPGYNLRPLEIEAAIGLIQLDKLVTFVANRQINAQYFTNKMRHMKFFECQTEIEASSWFGFAIILTGELEGKRKAILDKLVSNNIEVRPIVAGNFAKSPALKYLDYSIYDKLDNADYIHENGFFIGNHSVQMTDKLEGVFQLLEEFDNE